jgi:fumarate reductase subunit D
MNWRRFGANAGWSALLLPVAVFFGMMELGTVDRSECNWETFEYICSDYEGTYGIVCGVALVLWLVAIWAINRRPKT